MTPGRGGGSIRRSITRKFGVDISSYIFYLFNILKSCYWYNPLNISEGNIDINVIKLLSLRGKDFRNAINSWLVMCDI